MRPLCRLIIITMLACSTMFALATDYYVSCVAQDAGASDSNAGTSSGTPWKTLGKVYTTVTTSPSGGHRIYLRRGCRWNEPLVSKQSHAADSDRTIYDAYGTGAMPVVDGVSVWKTDDLNEDGTANEAWTWDATNSKWYLPVVRMRLPSGGVYSTIGCATFNSVGGQWVSALGGVDRHRDWFYDTTTSRFYAYVDCDDDGDQDDPTSCLTSLEICRGEWATYQGAAFVNADYVTFRNIEWRGFWEWPIRLSSGADNLTFENIIIRGTHTAYSDSDFNGVSDSSQYGAYVSSTLATVFSHVLVSGYIYGIYVAAGTATNAVTVSDSLITAQQTGGIYDVDADSVATLTYNHAAANGMSVASTINGTKFDVIRTGDTNGDSTYDNTANHNVARLSSPQLTGNRRYNPIVWFSYDDVFDSTSANQKAFWERIHERFRDEGLPLSVAIIPGALNSGNPNAFDVGTYARKWASWGQSVVFHTMHHWYVDEPRLFTVRYVAGLGTATISVTDDGTWATGVTLKAGGSTVATYDLTNASYDTIGELCTAIDNLADWTCTRSLATGSPPCSPGYDHNGSGTCTTDDDAATYIPSRVLFTITDKDAKTSPGWHVEHEVTRFISDDKVRGDAQMLAWLGSLYRSDLHIQAGHRRNQEYDYALWNTYGVRVSAGNPPVPTGENQSRINAVNGISRMNIGRWKINMTISDQATIDLIVRRLAEFSAYWGVPLGLYAHDYDFADTSQWATNVETCVKWAKAACKYATCMTLAQINDYFDAVGTNGLYDVPEAPASTASPNSQAITARPLYTVSIPPQYALGQPTPTAASPDVNAGNPATANPDMTGGATPGVRDIGPREKR